ncbi:DUF3099 domain-containing protein [Microlunatus parietis]|uniref:Putative tellurium resistance membrane protein TerC n=1 Tax=Microlunatus parietis TaxID=682979 RepID=A0A7Y9IC90_9ACTN|nr:DUF3099 domain-containing protein [Microlunatus parietis]NYE74135.1 putative tellurium resistance membrane protein TerC [Microlunatus parietis]
MRKAAVITDAPGAASAELSRRQKRYVITMLFRLACFIAIFFVPGVWRWVLGAGAVFLPYIAVILANQVDSRRIAGRSEPAAEPTAEPDRPQLEAVRIIEPDPEPEERKRDDAA